ncbi:MAG: hypothetical protein ACRESE_01905 [Gammaproteobacteria bacterium]
MRIKPVQPFFKHRYATNQGQGLGRADLAVHLLERVFAALGGGSAYAPPLLRIDPPRPEHPGATEEIRARASGEHNRHPAINIHGRGGQQAALKQIGYCINHKIPQLCKFSDASPIL